MKEIRENMRHTLNYFMSIIRYQGQHNLIGVQNDYEQEQQAVLKIETHSCKHEKVLFLKFHQLLCLCE